jgi:exodeoxyribonuclease-5
MPAPSPQLADHSARITALTALEASLLVEAGAGSGKTAIMAGRIVMHMAAGAAPKHLAAITFTELAASQLAERVTVFLEEVLSGTIRPELRPALPAGLTEAQRANLARAREAIDQLTCSTIHGFCQRLLKPYPVEAGMDPGARVIDPAEADLIFADLLDRWLRTRLSGEPRPDDLLVELILVEPDAAIGLVRQVAALLKRNPDARAAPSPIGGDPSGEFRAAAAAFRDCLDGGSCVEEETADLVLGFAELAEHCSRSAGMTEAQALAHLLFGPRPRAFTKSADKFLAYKKKGKWQAAAKAAGLSKAEADRLNDAATAAYEACTAAYDRMMAAASGRVLERLVADLQELLQSYRSHKRMAALLDFDDLLHGARDLLRRHDAVREALARRYRSVLVDEFQDTDPVQAEILWRLCGTPPDGRADAPWTAWTIRPGSLFLVGDPKQAIYRFRGADVAAYVQARDTLRVQRPESVIAISTNFRSAAGILDFVNARFEGPLSADGQPGFAALSSFHANGADGPCVATIEVSVEVDGERRPSAGELRDAEAEAVADACLHLIRNRRVRGEDGEPRPCRPGDVALLAPGGTELWRYEQALDDRGIPVSTQAGKGLFRRQEIQDLIAVTRVLADARDRLALGALLRGPLVGMTEQSLLDIVAALPAPPGAPEGVPKLSLWTDPAVIDHPIARGCLERLQGLARRARTTSPYALLCQAVDELRVRPLLLQRYRHGAERALANLDLYLEMSRSYSVRGLRAFADDMRANWEDAARLVEGRPDAEEQAVSLITMHAAKGLEWPVVIPINTMTGIQGAGLVLYDRSSNVVRLPVFGRLPAGYDDASQAESDESGRENVRLWYVAATRAKELLALPRLTVPPPSKSWATLVDFGLGMLDALDCDDVGEGRLPAAEAEERNRQDRAVFVAEAAAIAGLTRTIRWIVPSRSEGTPSAAPATERAVYGDAVEVDVDPATDAPSAEMADGAAVVRGGRERGLVLHKLMEEVLTGETAEDLGSLAARSEELVRQLGLTPSSDPAEGLSPQELAGAIVRTLALPNVAAVRARLIPECPIHASTPEDAAERIVSGVADALAVEVDGSVSLAIDWKSDVDPVPAVIEHYRVQLSEYLSATGAARGLIVLMTTGRVVELKSLS